MDLTSKHGFFDARFERVETSEGPAYLKVMTGEEQDEWQDWITAENKKPEVTAHSEVYCQLIVRTLCDDKGKRLFTSDEVKTLRGMNVKLLRELYKLSANLNFQSEEAKAELKKASEETTTN